MPSTSQIVCRCIRSIATSSPTERAAAANAATPTLAFLFVWAPMLQAQAEMMSQMQQKLADTMIRVCFKRCVTAPDASLNDRQRRCLDSCTKSFQEGFGIAVRLPRRSQLHQERRSRIGASRLGYYSGMARQPQKSAPHAGLHFLGRQGPSSRRFRNSTSSVVFLHAERYAGAARQISRRRMKALCCKLFRATVMPTGVA